MSIGHYHNITGGDCYILGNGPSLNDLTPDDWDWLKTHPTFGTNRIYLSGFTPKYYVCVNPLVLGQYGKEIAKLDCVKFIPHDHNFNNINGRLVGLNTTGREPGFSFDMTKPIWEGHTVTFVAMQLAYWMGFGRVILLGVDHDYGQLDGQPNEEVTAEGDDLHHFSPEYFKGVKWNLPDLARSELAYSLAKEAFESVDGKIINCSTRTKLDVFKIQPLNYTRSPWSYVSAIISAYKCGDLLQGCLEDIQDQTISKRVERVVVCQKESVEHRIAVEHQDQLDNPDCMKIIVTADVPTVYAAWNIGIKAASGRYITNANTDDRHHHRAYEIMVDLLDARQDIDLVYHDCYITWKAGETYREFEDSDHKQLVGGRFEGEPGIFTWIDYSRSMLGKGCFIGPQPMWRASLHQRYGYFVENYKVAGDYEFWLRIAKDKNFLHIPYPLGLYTANPKGIELSHPQETQEESFNAVALHQEPHMEINQAGNGLLRFDVGGKWFFTSKEEMQGFMESV